MTAQEVFYYSVTIGIWLLIIIFLYLSYRLISLINKVENIVFNLKKTLRPKNILSSITVFLIKLLKSAFNDKNVKGETGGGGRNEQ